MHSSLLAVALLFSLSCAKRESSPQDQAADGPTGFDVDTEARAALADAGCTVTGQAGRVVHATCGDVKQSFDLTNVDLTVASAGSRDEKVKVVGEFVEHLVSAGATSSPSQPPLADLRPALKTRAALDASMARVPPEIRAKASIPAKPLVGDILVVVMVDRADTASLVTAMNLEKWHTTVAPLFERALQNLDAVAREPHRVDVGVFAIDGKDTYEAARILSPTQRAMFEKALGGKAIFAIPSREDLAAAKRTDAAAVRALRAYATKQATGPYALTTDLFALDGDAWQTVGP